MNKENLKEKLKKYQTYILAALLIVSAIGISYAAFTFTKESNENVLSTGQIRMSYIEPDNSYVVEDALPMKDIDAMAINNYFEFTVSSHATTNVDDGDGLVIPYEISLGELAVDSDKTKLTKDQIKVYITKVESGKETVVNGPILLSELVESTKRDNASVIYNATDIHKNAGSEIITTYRIRAWIDYNVDASNFTKENRYQYKFNVNVNSIVGAQDYYKYCFATSRVTDDSGEVIGVSVDDYYCYEGNDRGYETRTDIVIPSEFSFGVYETITNPSAEASNVCKTVLINQYNFTESQIKDMCNGGTSGDALGNITLQQFADKYATETEWEMLVEYGLAIKVDKSQKLPLIFINDIAFLQKKLTNVIIPDSVTTIGNTAFGGNNLTSVVIPDSVTKIEGAAFAGNNLTSVVIPESVTTISEGAFSSNNLTSVVIPDSVTTIGVDAFANNNLTSVVIGNSVTAIGIFAFGDNNLTSVVIPDSVTTIGHSAFSSNNLTSVVIGENSQLTDIGSGAFYSMSSASNPNLTIYNNSGKSFVWENAVHGTPGTSFVTGTVPASENYNEVIIKEGYPS